MASGGSIVVRIAGDDSQLQSALARSQRGLQQFRGGLNVGVAAVGKYGAALAAVGVTLTAVFVNKHMKAIDSTAKLAASLNTTTESVTALQHAAKESGIEGMEGSLTRLNRRLGAAEFGAGAAAVTVKALNLDLEALSKMPVDERVASIADTIRDSGVSFQQAARHLQNLGFEQKEATAVFMQGGEAFREARKQAEALGLTYSDIDAAQVEAAATAMGRVSDIVTGVGNKLTIELAPYIEEVAQQLTNLTTQSGGFGEVITNSLVWVMRAMGRLGNVIQGVRVAYKSLEVVGIGFAAAVVSASQLAWEGVSLFIDGLLTGVNVAIDALNKLPKVDIARVDMMGDSAFMGGIRESGDQIRDMVRVAAGELHELAMQELPADKIERFLEAVQERSREAAKEVAAARAAMQGGGFGGAGEIDEAAEKEAEKHREQIAARIERIRQGFLTESEVQHEHYAVAQEALSQALAMELLTQSEHDAQLEALEEQHIERLGAIRKAGLTDLQRFTESSYRAQVASVSGHLADMTAGVARENRAMFNLNKAAGISNAIVSAYEGVSLTMSKYPYPLNIGMAAAHAAAAFAQVNAIRSASFGGGGGAAPSLAGGTPATPVTPVEGGTPSGGGQATIVNLHGDTFGREQVRDLLEQINESSADGGRIILA